MKTTKRFILINVTIITLINTLVSVIGRLASNEFIYKYSSINLLLIFVVIPIYLIILKNVFISNDNFFSYNSLSVFLIIGASNVLMYIIDSRILDKIFEVPADLDNIIIFFIHTTCQFLVLIFLVLLTLLWRKFKKSIS